MCSEMYEFFINLFWVLCWTESIFVMLSLVRRISVFYEQFGYEKG